MPEQQLISKLKSILLDNISNELYGVNELAEQSGMSRSTLLRKVQKETGKTVNQFIKEIRLEESLKLLKETDLTVSEISFNVGFNSTSYFIKCFKDEYGISPGEYNSQEEINEKKEKKLSTAVRKKGIKKLYLIYFLILVIISVFVIYWISKPKIKIVEKSIAVLPFKNNSGDSTNIYLVNGLMDAILNNLQKIKDLKVVSRTSVEKYRNSLQTIPEISGDLGVSYFVEGSVQKIDNRILLNVQLIDGVNDKQVWSEQYNRKLTDIFDIQKEVASKIASRIEAKITPLEQKRIDEIPTNDMQAYDFFLQGLDLLQHASESNINKAIPLFTKAIERDTNFARAYAAIAMSYYYLDIFQFEKKHVDQLNYFAEKAYLIDPQLPQSLVAKAFSYMIKGDYNTAVSYFEKALEYNPNSAFVINFLSDFYTNYIPNTQKYLEYALKGMQIDKSLNDSTSNSYLYLHVANAFMQTGFLDEALEYIDKSLEYNPSNIYSMYVKVYVNYAKYKNIKQTNSDLLKIYSFDTTRLDVIQEVAKTYYTMEDYENAYFFYKKLLDAREEQNVYLFVYEDIKIAWTYKQMGYDEGANRLINEFKNYAENDNSIYHSLMMAEYYAYIGDNSNSLEELQKFSEKDGYHIWTLFLPKEPFMKKLIKNPQFLQKMRTIENKFQNQHKELKEHLKQEGLL